MEDTGVSRHCSFAHHYTTGVLPFITVSSHLIFGLFPGHVYPSKLLAWVGASRFLHQYHSMAILQLCHTKSTWRAHSGLGLYWRHHS